MNDRSQGGSAYNSGNIELMMNRRGTTSDDLGNEEPLDEVEIIDGTTRGVRVQANYKIFYSNDRAKAFSTLQSHHQST